MFDPANARHSASTQGAGTAMLEFDAVSKSFGPIPVLEEISLKIERGNFVALVGPSGCGKTTLLNLAAGLMQPETGAVYYNGAKLLQPNTNAGYLTQDDALLPWRDVLTNVALPLEIKGIKKAARLERRGTSSPRSACRVSSAIVRRR
jgi:NitT/TauT family transport system ATP-binding protein